MRRVAGGRESRYISKTMCDSKQTHSLFPVPALALAGLLLRGRAR
jgi:hypothetical protein